MNWKFTHIHHAFRRQAGISLNEYAVLDLIYKSHTFPKTKTIDGWATCSYSDIGDFLGLSKGAIHKIIERMEGIGLVEINPAHPSQKRTTAMWFENAYLDDEKETEKFADLVKVQKVNATPKVQKVNGKSSKSELFRSKSERHINKRKKPLSKGIINNTPDGVFFDSEIESSVDKVLERLNELSGRKLPVNGVRGESNRSKARALFKKNYTEAEILEVIQLKCFEWCNNPNMFQYLHPTTLFRPSNFKTYLDLLNDLKSNPEKANLFKKKINGLNNRNSGPTAKDILPDETVRIVMENLHREGFFNQ